MVLPALFIVVPGDTLSAAAGELLSGRLTAGGIRLVFAFFTLGLIVVGVVAAAGVTGNGHSLAETLPPPNLPYLVILAGWVVFCVGMVLVFNAEPAVLTWLVPSVLGTFLVQQGVTALFGWDVVSGLQNLADFALQIPTVAVAIAIGVIVSDRWRHRRVL
jgi:hypothetical protein